MIEWLLFVTVLASVSLLEPHWIVAALATAARSRHAPGLTHVATLQFATFFFANRVHVTRTTRAEFALRNEMILTPQAFRNNGAKVTSERRLGREAAIAQHNTAPLLMPPRSDREMSSMRDPQIDDLSVTVSPTVATAPLRRAAPLVLGRQGRSEI